MRPFSLPMLVAACSTLAGCNTPPGEHEPLRIDVLVTQYSLELHAHEADTPDPCTNPFPEIGTSDATTDALECESDVPPAAWLDRIFLDGRPGTCTWMPPEPCVLDTRLLGALDDETLVITTHDGGETRIPLPGTTPPVAVIEDVVDDGTTTTVTWSAEPGAASVIAALETGFGGPRLHVAAGDPVELPSIPDSFQLELLVWALAAPELVPVGDTTVRFWIGTIDARDLRGP